MKKHKANWQQIPDHPYRMLTIGDFESGKTNPLLNWISHRPDNHKIYLHAKDSY